MEVDVTVEVDVVSRSWTQRWCRGAGRSSGVAGWMQRWRYGLGRSGAIMV